MLLRSDYFYHSKVAHQIFLDKFVFCFKFKRYLSPTRRFLLLLRLRILEVRLVVPFPTEESHLILFRLLRSQILRQGSARHLPLTARILNNQQKGLERVAH